MMEEFRGNNSEAVNALNQLSEQIYNAETWFYRHSSLHQPEITLYIGHLEQRAIDTLERAIDGTFKGYPIINVHKNTHSVVYISNYQKRLTDLVARPWHRLNGQKRRR